MHSLEYMKKLIAEIKPAMKEIKCIDEDAGGNWKVTFDEGFVVNLSFADTFNKITFSSLLCKPVSTDLKDLYETLLIFNYLYEETGGVRMALDEQTGSVMQLFDISVQDLDIEMLTILLTNFVCKSQYWMLVLRSQSHNEPGAEAGTGSKNLMGDMMSGAIRA